MYWYEDEIKRIENERKRMDTEPDILFYGSSTIRMWDTLALDFPKYSVVNLGFGGSTLAACTWFFERVMLMYQPKMLVLYAGDNDLGDGRHPEEVLIFFQQIMAKISVRFESIPCFYISLKPSPARWHLNEQFRYTNNLIQNEIIKCNDNWKFINIFNEMLDHNSKPNPQFYDNDGLHLSKKGYVLWKNTIAGAVAKRI